jgi:hypothetical protein
MHATLAGQLQVSNEQFFKIVKEMRAIESVIKMMDPDFKINRISCGDGIGGRGVKGNLKKLRGQDENTNGLLWMIVIKKYCHATPLHGEDGISQSNLCGVS